MAKTNGIKRCSICGQHLKKNGKSAAGSQRWKCTSCHAGTSFERPDNRRNAQVNQFAAWLLSTRPQAQVTAASDRSFRRNTAWCWHIIPLIPLTGEVYDEILIDGIHIGKMVCLIARTPQFVVGWYWAQSESTETWRALLNQFPPPRVVVCDGGTGMNSALRMAWPHTKIQRCLYHVQAHVRSKLTMNPRLLAGQRLAVLTKNLTPITSAEEAILWTKSLNLWYRDWAQMLKERTYISTKNGRTRWEYTHKNLRNAYFHLEHLVIKNQMFTFLEPNLADLTVDRTTNYLEGRINSQLRTLLKAHRGMPFTQQQRLVEWYLHSRSQFPMTPKELAQQAKETHHQIQNQVQTINDSDIGQPALYDTGLGEDFQWTTTS
ncbi:IS1249 family transposase [Jonesiaceae bacterium BS-20]|uniref:IS1249 family transposase n=1 Tax=Jonesiaceae bacterium BS-20 TaxID=3120821 RepID=A0AAU7DU41_9MICO